VLPYLHKNLCMNNITEVSTHFNVSCLFHNLTYAMILSQSFYTLSWPNKSQKTLTGIQALKTDCGATFLHMHCHELQIKTCLKIWSDRMSLSVIIFAQQSFIKFILLHTNFINTHEISFLKTIERLPANIAYEFSLIKLNTFSTILNCMRACEQ